MRLLLTEEYTTALTQHLDRFASSSRPGTPSNSVPPTPALGGALAIDGASSTPNGGITSFFAERAMPGSPRGTAGAGGSMGSLFDLLGHKPTKLGTPATLTPAYTPGLPTSAPGSPGGSDMGSTASSLILQRGSLAAGLATIGGTSGHARGSSVASSTADLLVEEEFSKESYKLKPHFMDAIKELAEEVENTHVNVAEQSLDHIHSG